MREIVVLLGIVTLGFGIRNSSTTLAFLGGALILAAWLGQIVGGLMVVAGLGYGAWQFLSGTPPADFLPLTGGLLIGGTILAMAATKHEDTVSCRCADCGNVYGRWPGQCPRCGCNRYHEV